MKMLSIFYMMAYLLALSACLSPDERANKLMVEVVQLIQAAEGEPSAQKKLELLMQARSNLQTIVDNYPSTDLAVKLISEQPIGNVSLASVNKAIKSSEPAACLESPTPTYACVFATAQLIKSDAYRAWHSATSLLHRRKLAMSRGA